MSDKEALYHTSHIFVRSTYHRQRNKEINDTKSRSSCSCSVLCRASSIASRVLSSALLATSRNPLYPHPSSGRSSSVLVSAVSQFSAAARWSLSESAHPRPVTGVPRQFISGAIPGWFQLVGIVQNSCVGRRRPFQEGQTARPQSVALVCEVDNLQLCSVV